MIKLVSELTAIISAMMNSSKSLILIMLLPIKVNNINIAHLSLSHLLKGSLLGLLLVYNLPLSFSGDMLQRCGSGSQKSP